MRKIKYPLIVSDFDGTLVREDGTISERTRTAIRKYVEAGGHFAISTGRMPTGILPRARELGLTGVVCCGQGPAIVGIQNNEVISTGRMSNDVAVAICEKMERLNLHIHVYDLWDYYSNMNDDALAAYEKVVGVKAIVKDEKPISQFVRETNLQPFKILAAVAPEDNEKVRLELEAENFKDCQVTRSSIFLVEVGNAKYSKGTAVNFLAERYGANIESVIAVGDQRNDLAMIEVAGLGIAVKNADEALKEAANLVLEYTNDEDAIAEIIEKYAYMEE